MTARSAPPPLPSRMGLGRPAVLISLGLHVAFFVITLGVPRLLASSSKAAPIYVVDLISFGGGSPGPAAPPSGPPAPSKPAQQPAPAPPAPRPKKVPEKSIVIPERGAKKPPPKPVAKKPVVKPEAPKPEAEEDDAAEAPGTADAADTKPVAATTAPGATASSGAPAGVPGGTPGGAGAGGVGNGVGGDAYNFYLALLDRSIKGAWKRPLYNGTDVLTATVRMEISRSGRVVKLDLVTKSGLEALDRSVVRAVRDAEPFPPLPTNVTLDLLPVQIVFELNPLAPGSGSPGE